MEPVMFCGEAMRFASGDTADVEERRNPKLFVLRQQSHHRHGKHNKNSQERIVRMRMTRYLIP